MLKTNEEQVDINMLLFYLFFPTQLAFDLKAVMFGAEV